MATYEANDCGNSSAPSPKSNYSAKLESLLSFLDEQTSCCENDDPNKLSSSVGRGEAGDISSPSIARVGLADITNSKHASTGTCEEKKEIKEQHVPQGTLLRKLPPAGNSSKGKAPVAREKKYIWDDWEKTQDGEMVLIQDEPKMAPGDEIEENKTTPSGLPANAKQQLQELKSMSAEIQTRAAAMKVELEHRRKKVEELHSLRVNNESDHVNRMKLIKQEWSKSHKGAKAGHEEVMSKQQHQKVTLSSDCESLEKKMASIKSDIQRKETSEKETCQRLRREGAQQLDEAKKSWQQAEKDALKKKDQRTAEKLRKDAAKAVEPKLRQLMERNKEEIERLEREAARELDCYKLELFRLSNEQFKKETNKIRLEERKKMSHHEEELAAKMESRRREHEYERKKAIEEQEQRRAMLKRQFTAEKQKMSDEHEILLDDVLKTNDLETEQVRVVHKREMAALEDEYLEKVAQKQSMCEEEFVEWKAMRGRELHNEEDTQLKEEYSGMKLKAESDIAMVKRKLAEEQKEKRQQFEVETANRNKSIQEKNDTEIRRLERKLKQAANETNTLRKHEAEESRLVNELQKKNSCVKESIQAKEDSIARQERRLSSFVKGCQQQILNIEEDGERRIKEVRLEKASFEKQADLLLANLPVQQDSGRIEIDELKAQQAKETELAEMKIQALIKSKKTLLEEASARLLSLREKTAEVERDLDKARKVKVLAGEKES